MGNFHSSALANLDPSVTASSDPKVLSSTVREHIQKLARDPSKQAIYKLLQKELLNQDDNDEMIEDRGYVSAAASSTGQSTSREGDLSSAGPSSKDKDTESLDMVKESQQQDKAASVSVTQASHAQPDALDLKEGISKARVPVPGVMGPPIQLPYSQTDHENPDNTMDNHGSGPKDRLSPFSGNMAPKKKFLGEFRNRSTSFNSVTDSSSRSRSSSFTIPKDNEQDVKSDETGEDRRMRSTSFGGTELAIRKSQAMANMVNQSKQNSPTVSEPGSSREVSIAGVWYSRNTGDGSLQKTGSPKSHYTDGEKNRLPMSSQPNWQQRTSSDSSSTSSKVKPINIRSCIDAIIESSVVRERLGSMENKSAGTDNSRVLLSSNSSAEMKPRKEQFSLLKMKEERESSLRPQDFQQVQTVLQKSSETEKSRPYTKMDAVSGLVAATQEPANNKHLAASQAKSKGEHNPISQLAAQVESVMRRHFDPSNPNRDERKELGPHDRPSPNVAQGQTLKPMTNPEPNSSIRGWELNPTSQPQLNMTMAMRASPQQAQPRKVVTAPIPPIQATHVRPPQMNVQYLAPPPGLIPLQTPEGIKLVHAPYPGQLHLISQEALAQAQAQAQVQDEMSAQMGRSREETRHERPPLRQEKTDIRFTVPEHKNIDSRHGRLQEKQDFRQGRPGYPSERKEFRREPSPSDRKYDHAFDMRSLPESAVRRSPQDNIPRPAAWNREPSLSPRERQVQEALRQEQQRLAELRMAHNRPPHPRSPPDLRSMEDQHVVSSRAHGHVDSHQAYLPRSSPHEMHSTHGPGSVSPKRPHYSSHSPLLHAAYGQMPANLRTLGQLDSNTINVKETPLDLTVKKDSIPPPALPQGHPPRIHSINKDKSPVVSQGPAQEKQAVAHILHDTVKKHMSEYGMQKVPYPMPQAMLSRQAQNVRTSVFAQTSLQGPTTFSQAPPGMVVTAPRIGVAEIPPQPMLSQIPSPASMMLPGPRISVAAQGPTTPVQEVEAPVVREHSPQLLDDAFCRNGNPVSTRTSGTNILGSHSPNDILYLKCNLCGSTYGSLHSFRKHFSKAHSCEALPEHVTVQTISATKNALAKVGDDKVEEKQTVLESLNLLPSNVYYENQLARYKTERLSDGETPLRQVAEVHPVKSQVEGGRDVAKVKPYTESAPSPHSPSQGGQMQAPGSDLNIKKEQSTMKCLQCGQDFPTRDWGVFKRHVRAHEAALDNPYRCSTCKTGFRELAEWRTHMSVTHMIKACVCCTCGSGFSHPSSLNKHVEIIHKGLANTEVEYKCLFCPKQFSKEHELYEHTQEHERSRLEYYKSKIADKSSSSSPMSSSPLSNSPGSRSPHQESHKEDTYRQGGSPTTDAEAEYYGRSRSMSFSNTPKIAEEAKREEEMRPRATSFLSPFRHAFQNYLEKMVEKEHKKQCVDDKEDTYLPSKGKPQQVGTEKQLPTIQEGPEPMYYGDVAQKRKAELDRSALEVKMAKLESRMRPASDLKDKCKRVEYRTTRSIMEEMVEKSVNMYGTEQPEYHIETDRHTSSTGVPTSKYNHQTNDNAFLAFPLREMGRLKRESPDDSAAYVAPVAKSVTKAAFSNQPTLSAAELAHRIIESRVKLFSEERKQSAHWPPGSENPLKLPNTGVQETFQANPGSARLNAKMSDAASLKNFIEDLVAAEVSNYDNSEETDRPSILAQLGEPKPERRKSSPTPIQPPSISSVSVERRLSGSEGVAAPEESNEKTESFGSKFDKIRRHHKMKQSKDVVPKEVRSDSSRSTSPTSVRSTPVAVSISEHSKSTVTHTNAIDIVHATISKMLQSSEPSSEHTTSQASKAVVKAENTSKTDLKKGPSPCAMSGTQDANTYSCVQTTKSSSGYPSVSRTRQDPSRLSLGLSPGNPQDSVGREQMSSPSSVGGHITHKGINSVLETTEDRPPSVGDKKSPMAAESLSTVKSENVTGSVNTSSDTHFDPPSPFSECSENNLQIVLPEDDEEDERCEQERLREESVHSKAPDGSSYSLTESCKNLPQTETSWTKKVSTTGEPETNEVKLCDKVPSRECLKRKSPTLEQDLSEKSSSGESGKLQKV